MSLNQQRRKVVLLTTSLWTDPETSATPISCQSRGPARLKKGFSQNRTRINLHAINSFSRRRLEEGWAGQTVA